MSSQTVPIIDLRSLIVRFRVNKKSLVILSMALSYFMKRLSTRPQSYRRERYLSLTLNIMRAGQSSTDFLLNLTAAGQR